MSLPVAILAGGLATRLWPLTEAIPKSLVDVGGRPFAELQLELLTSHGIRDVVFLAGHLGDMLADTLGDGSRWARDSHVLMDRAPSTGAPCLCASGSGDRFFVLLGLVPIATRPPSSAHSTSGKSGPMTARRNVTTADASNVQFSGG